MSAQNEKFAAHGGCMDGRGDEAVQEHAGSGVYIDRVCSGPGAVAGIAARDEFYIEQLRRCLPVTIGKHGTNEVYISGHAECAGNPIDDQLHKQQVLQAATVVEELLDELGLSDGVEVIPLWDERGADMKWYAHVLQDSDVETVVAA